jgi:putative tricarboxylic transport membrane protein
MHRADTVFAALLLLGAVLLVPQALKLPVAWTSIGPGSGFFPFWLVVGVVFQTALILVRSLRVPVPPGRAAPFLERESVRPLLIVFLPMVAVISMIRYLGLYFGGGLYLAGYMIFVGRQRWVTVLLVSVLLPVALFFIFERWFLLPMPKGTLLEYLLYGR